VLFYLEDNSVSINEEKFENSGIPQGKFLKREKYVQENGKFLTAYDFHLGQAITLYGRSIYLYNCDDYTREFYEKAGQPQGPAEPYDNDQWTSTVTNKWVPKKDAQMKEYLEKKLGGGKVNSEKQFLENDRKVLKFFARFEGAPFIVHYFLADDTIEVREVSLPNSGKDPFPVTFRRQKLAKNFALNQPGQTYAENFLRAEELTIGRALDVFGRSYILEGCDDFTRNYYLTKFSIVFPADGNQNSGKEAPKSSKYLITQTSLFRPTMASVLSRTRWVTSSG
jgi:EF-hand domain-containing protein 1